MGVPIDGQRAYLIFARLVLDFERGDVTPPWTVKHIGELYGISQPTAARWMHLLAELFELDRNADSHWVHRFT